jgi:hypothetical protein
LPDFKRVRLKDRYGIPAHQKSPPIV